MAIRVAILGLAGLLAAATLAAEAKPAPKSVSANDIVKSPALKAKAMTQGAKVFAANCAVCHGKDLKGLPDKHTPDLTDALWLYSGDDLDSGGLTMFPSDVEKTVLYGIRSGHPKARAEAVMPGLGPNDKNVLSDSEIRDVIEHVMVLSGGQPQSEAAAARGKALFADKGNCFDCHLPDGRGNGALGSADLTNPKIWLYGTGRDQLFTTIREGVAGQMPAFEGKLTPAQVRAVSVYVFSKAARPPG